MNTQSINLTAGQIIRDVSLVSLERRSTARSADLISRAFLTLAQLGIPVWLISQSSSAGNFCFAIPKSSVQSVLHALENEFNTELAHRDITRLWASDSVIIAGIEVRVASAICEWLASQGIHIPVMVQSAATQSVSLVIEDTAVPYILSAVA